MRRPAGAYRPIAYECSRGEANYCACLDGGPAGLPGGVCDGTRRPSSRGYPTDRPSRPLCGRPGVQRPCTQVGPRASGPVPASRLARSGGDLTSERQDLATTQSSAEPRTCRDSRRSTMRGLRAPCCAPGGQRGHPGIRTGYIRSLDGYRRHQGKCAPGVNRSLNGAFTGRGSAWRVLRTLRLQSMLDAVPQ